MAHGRGWRKASVSFRFQSNFSDRSCLAPRTAGIVTFGCAVAELALEAASAVDELHVGTHVRLAAVTPHRSEPAEVHHRRLLLQPATKRN